MGLDMYLRASLYISPYDFGESVELRQSIAKLIGKEESEDSAERVTGVTMRVAQWRKSNQIHQWFVDNVQNGEDDCKAYWVSREKLNDLYGLCQQVVSHRKATGEQSFAEAHLPTAEGFFFGGVEYGEGYYQDLEYTMQMLSPAVLDKYVGWDFEYQSSW